jgi:hypothetical protein
MLGASFRNRIIVGIVISSLFVSLSYATQATSDKISSYGQIRNLTSGRLHTDGRWIKNNAGEIIRLKGAAVFWKFEYCSSYSDYDPLSYSDEINETSLDLFASTGANFIRLTVNGYLWYVKGAQKYMAAVDTVIGWCKQRNIMVVLDNHGWYNPDVNALYKPKAQMISELTEWEAFMVALAQRYVNESTVVGFDMLNEPGSEGYADLSVWRANVMEVIRAIHAVDPSYLCFVEPLRSGTVIGAMDDFKNNPLPEPNIVYSAHNYYEWDYPWIDYAKNYGSGNFDVARQQLEQEYYARWINMIEANLPVINMETGVYRDNSTNPNWDVWENDSLTLYEKYKVSACWYPFDPDRQDSTLVSLLAADRETLTSVGTIWASHMNNI